jgi:uncharacterized protein YdeI (YjbR/CyaY-like superfamily)
MTGHILKTEFFATQAEFRDWLKVHHAEADELYVGFHKKASGIPSITYSEALDEALCFGWIDGVRRSVDDARYAIRFTPRKPDSSWSAVNIARARALIGAGRMHASGLRVFESRTKEKKIRYSDERKAAALDATYEKALKSNNKAWDYFQSKPPSYRRAAIFWIMSAKKEETRLKRLAQLIEFSEAGKTIPPLTRP